MTTRGQGAAGTGRGARARDNTLRARNCQSGRSSGSRAAGAARLIGRQHRADPHRPLAGSSQGQSVARCSFRLACALDRGAGGPFLARRALGALVCWPAAPAPALTWAGATMRRPIGGDHRRRAAPIGRQGRAGERATCAGRSSGRSSSSAPAPAPGATVPAPRSCSRISLWLLIWLAQVAF